MFIRYSVPLASRLESNTSSKSPARKINKKNTDSKTSRPDFRDEKSSQKRNSPTRKNTSSKRASTSTIRGKKAEPEKNEGVRINKYLADAGIGARRAANCAATRSG